MSIFMCLQSTVNYSYGTHIQAARAKSSESMTLPLTIDEHVCVLYLYLVSGHGQSCMVVSSEHQYFLVHFASEKSTQEIQENENYLNR